MCSIIIRQRTRTFEKSNHSAVVKLVFTFTHRENIYILYTCIREILHVLMKYRVDMIDVNTT